MKKENKFKGFLATHKNKFWTIGVVLLVLVLIFTVVLPALNRNNSQSGTEDQVETVARGSITETVGTYGILESQPSVTLTWKTDGIVGDFDLEVGDIVEKDDVLMELELSSQSTEILNAYSDLLEAQNELELLTTTDANYQEILADLVYQEQMLINKRADKLAWNYGQSSEERVDAVWDNYYAARSEVWELEDDFNEVKSLDENDPARVEAYEALQDGILKRNSLLRALNQIIGIPFDIAVETDFIEYDQQAATVAEARVAYNRYVDGSEEINAVQANVQSYQNLINKARIIAPFTGTVTSISAVAGEFIDQGAEAIRIDNMDNLVVEVKITQADINKIEIGQIARMSFDAIYKKEYTGFVQAISKDGTEDSNGVVQYQVEIKVEGADEDVKPGFTAIVDIVVSEAEDALLVANNAVMTQEDGTNVVAVINDDGSMDMIPVEIGAKSDLYTAISNGEIEEGDQVVILSTYGASSMIDQMLEAQSGESGMGNNLRDMRNDMIFNE